SKWSEIPVDTVRKDVYRFTDEAVYLNEKGKVVPWAPNRNKIANLIEALQAVMHTTADEMPSWLVNGYENYPAEEIVSAANGLLHVQSRSVLEHTPNYFNQVAVPFDYEPAASRPLRWLDFLDDLWSGDQEAVDAIQE